MNKKLREKIFQKYGGRCSYCGCDLTGTRWHVDHAEPVIRKRKHIGSGWFHIETGEPAPNDKALLEKIDWRKYQHRKGRWVPDGFHQPENDTEENYMPACASCNINKHSMNIDQFRDFIARFVVSLNKRNVQYIVAKRYGLIAETGIKVQFYFETHNPETH